jgi:GNAT superfamily N-acetyltransferase
MNTGPSINIIFEVAKTDEHFNQILTLQKDNLFTFLSEELQSKEGFVFAEHTLAVLKNMATHLPQMVALHNNEVIGYNLAMTSSMQNELPRLTPMFDAFKRCIYKDKPLVDYKFIVGGQVCVDKNFRGRGLLGKLYQETAKRLPAGYEFCITEISSRNVKSLKAHQKIGFEIVDSYDDGKEIWDIVVWDIQKLYHPDTNKKSLY